jgi:hypothetical protein
MLAMSENILSCLVYVFFLSRPPDNDFDPSALQRCRDIVYINLFDQCDIDLPTTEREQDQIIHKRISRNWLGSIKIPFSNIYVNGRVNSSIQSRYETCEYLYYYSCLILFFFS